MLGEYCGLSPRFIANVELGDSTFSIDSLMTVCDILSCSSDYLLFGIENADSDWGEVTSKLLHLDIRFKEQIAQITQSAIEIIAKAESLPEEKSI